VNVVKQFLRVRMCDKCLSGYYGDLGLVFMVTIAGARTGFPPKLLHCSRIHAWNHFGQ